MRAWLLVAVALVGCRTQPWVLDGEDDMAAPDSATGPSPRWGRLAADPDHSCAVVPDCTVRCWGFDHDGDLGARGPAAATAVVVAGLDYVVAVSAGGPHSCALRDDGSIT